MATAQESSGPEGMCDSHGPGVATAVLRAGVSKSESSAHNVSRFCAFKSRGLILCDLCVWGNESFSLGSVASLAPPWPIFLLQ